jgi:ectoine hydroxylase-related dioxygenase (phytanoyl-CoA dioxygenase family)
MVNHSDIKKRFIKNGFVIIKNLLSTKEIKQFENDFIEVYSRILKKKLNKENLHKIIYNKEINGEYELLYKCYKKFLISSSFKSSEKKFSTFSKKIFRKNFKLLKTGVAIGIKNSNRTAYNWHQEQTYFNKLQNTLHYQFPIFNSCHKKNGTMSVLARSHLMGNIKQVKNIKYSEKSINTYLPTDIRKIKKRFKEKFIKMNLGDVCLFHENIIHKTNKNYTNKIRFVPIIRLKSLLA